MKRLLLAVAAFFMTCMAQAQVYNQFSPGGDLAGAGSSWNVQFLAPGAVTLAKQANFAANSIRGNSGVTGVGQDLNPLAAANLMSAVLSVVAVSTTNVTLSGLQTIDGISLAQGQSVLLIGQTTSADRGIYIVQSGAWTRAINFPNGYVIAQNCDLVVLVKQGTAFGNTPWRLLTASGSITIGTTAQSWLQMTIPAASPTVAGVAKITESGDKAAGFIVGGTVAHVQDCVDFNDTSTGVSGTISDDGNAGFVTGPCVVSDPNGHPLSVGTPAVTGTGCTLAAGTNTDNSGAIVAAGIDTCTLAFAGAFTVAPHCAVGNIGATVIANLTALPTTAHAIFLTTAAGTFNYVCY